MDKLEWSALEYEERERSADWFWALGIIVICGVAAAIIFRNYFFAVLLLLSGVLLGFFAVKKPETIFYELNQKGLKIRNQTYPYENIKSFWVQIDLAGENKLRPTLFIKLERAVMPIVSIPIEDAAAEDIRDIMLSQNVAEE